LVSIVGDTLQNANLTENCVKITDFNGVDRDYLYYYLKSARGQAEIAKGTVGAVQAKLPIKNIQDISIDLPDLTVQKKISNILASIDHKIAVNMEINDNLAA
jgi:type I restriction enzyme S subunit